MSQLNQLPNLRVEDFPSQQSWIGKLFIQMNPFIQAVYSVMNQNIDFFSNIKSVSKDYDVTNFSEFSFLWSFSDVLPRDVRVISAVKGASQTPCILLLAWSYDVTTKTITISKMVELLDSSIAQLNGNYKFTIRATV